MRIASKLILLVLSQRVRQCYTNAYGRVECTTDSKPGITPILACLAFAEGPVWSKRPHERGREAKTRTVRAIQEPNGTNCYKTAYSHGCMNFLIHNKPISQLKNLEPRS